MATDPERENRHAERIRTLRGRFSQPEKIVKTDSEIVSVPREIADHHFTRERVVSGRYRSVRRKNVGRGNHLEGSVIFQSFILNVLVDPFQGEKRGVALVHMVDLRMDP